MGGVVGDALDFVTDDVLGFDPGGGGIYDVGRDVLGDTIADDILGFDPNGGGIVPIANTAAKIAVAYAAGNALGAALGPSAAVDSFALADATQLAAQGLSEAAITQNLVATGLTATEAAAAAAAGVDAMFIASDAAQLAQQGLNPAAIEQNLVAAGVDPVFAASAAQSAGMGGTAVDIAGDLAGFSGGQGLYSAGSGSFLDSLGRVVDSAGNILGNVGGAVGDVLGGLGQFGQQIGQSLFGSVSGPSTTANTLAGALASGVLTQQEINNLKNLGSQAQQQYGQLAQQATQGIDFTPYGVTTSLFSTTPTAGGVTSALTGQGQQLSDAALQAALGSYQQAGTADLGQMTQERMNLYQQLVAPEQERSRLATEARLAAQGRLGIGAGGGEYAPELRALQDAIAKQNLQFALQAPQEALAQRASLLQQGASAAAIPTGLAGQQLQAAQQSGVLGQQAAQTAYQRGGLLGTLGGQGISEQLLANIAAAQVASERNKAIGQALSGALGSSQAQQQTASNYLTGTTGGTGGYTGTPGFGGNLLSDLQYANNLYQTGSNLYNAGSNLFSGIGSLFGSGATQNPVTSANSTSFPMGVRVTPENYDAYFNPGFNIENFDPKNNLTGPNLGVLTPSNQGLVWSETQGQWVQPGPNSGAMPTQNLPVMSLNGTLQPNPTPTIVTDPISTNQRPSTGVPNWLLPPSPGTPVTQALTNYTNPYTGETVTMGTGGYRVNVDAQGNSLNLPADSGKTVGQQLGYIV